MGVKVKSSAFLLFQFTLELNFSCLTLYNAYCLS